MNRELKKTAAKANGKAAMETETISKNVVGSINHTGRINFTKGVIFLVCIAMLGLTVASCGGSSKSDPGVVINGVKWATRNTGADGKFVSSPEEVGYNGSFYSIPDSLFPKGWRLPTEKEFISLIKKSDEMVEQNGMHGVLFGTEPNTIFMPSVPVITGGTYVLDRTYWSSTSNKGYVRTIKLGNTDYIYSTSHNEKGSIRLVYDETAK
jgi:hypothetical protein